jgi:hypothetical protein
MKTIYSAQAIAALFVAAVLGGTAKAQVLELPAREIRQEFGRTPAAPDPARTRHEMVLGGSVLGGYESSLVAPFGGDPFTRNPSGNTGYASAGLHYYVGREARWLDVTGTSFVNAYRNVGLTPSFGGDVSVRGRAKLWRGGDIMLSQNVIYQPFFSLGTFRVENGAQPLVPETADVGTDAGASADADPRNGLIKSPSWYSNSGARLGIELNRSTSIATAYSYSRRAYFEGSDAFETNNHLASIMLNRSFTRSTDMYAFYRRAQTQFTEVTGRQPTTGSDEFEGGIQYARQFSRTRRILTGGGVGASRMETIPTTLHPSFKYWAPAGFGQFRLDVGRSWAVSGEYRRARQILEGLQPLLYITHMATLSTGGYLNRRVETVFALAYSNGMNGTLDSDGNSVGHYNAVAGTAQLRFMLSRQLAAAVAFNRVQYRLRDPEIILNSVAADLNRNTVRVGLTWELPVFDSYIDRRVRPTPPRQERGAR